MVHVATVHVCNKAAQGAGKPHPMPMAAGSAEPQSISLMRLRK